MILSVSVFGLLCSSLLFFHNILAAVSSGLPRVSPVYLGIEMIQTFKMISQVESFICPDKQGAPEEGRRIERPKR